MPSNYNFLDIDKKKLKINNYESKYKNNNPINIIYLKNSIYSINIDGDLLSFDLSTGKLIEKINIPILLDIVINSFETSRVAKPRINKKSPSRFFKKEKKKSSMEEINDKINSYNHIIKGSRVELTRR